MSIPSTDYFKGYDEGYSDAFEEIEDAVEKYICVSSTEDGIDSAIDTKNEILNIIRKLKEQTTKCQREQDYHR